MKMVERIMSPEEQAEFLSICTILAGEAWYGLDTRRIREVIGAGLLQSVPLAPAYIGGVVPYRGEVLTAVCLRSLLGLDPAAPEGCILVLDDGLGGEENRFGLVVDRVGGVMSIDRRTLAPNPSTLEDRGQAIFEGAFRMEHGLVVQLSTERLTPVRLAESGLFAKSMSNENAWLDARSRESMSCAH